MVEVDHKPLHRRQLELETVDSGEIAGAAARKRSLGPLLLLAGALVW